MPKNVLNLELSSGGFSAVAPGVEALEPAAETVAEFVVEPGRAFSAARSAMVFGLFASSRYVFRCLRNVLSGWRQRNRRLCRCIVAVRVPAGDPLLGVRVKL